MAYDERLVGRLRRLLGGRPGASERKMFGGVAFLIDGKMVVGVNGVDLMVRVGAERHAAALARPHVRLMDFTGRPLTGFVYVAPAGYRAAASLRRWVDEAAAYVATLPRAARRDAASRARPGARPAR
jgi:TfoX/Sxy family transcriptional regulator of competence genes